MAHVRRARAATPWRTVRFTRSIKVVFNRPERPNPIKATLRAASVPRPITGVTRTSLGHRSAFLHLAIDQTCLHLPLTHFPPSATHLEPLTEVSRGGREGEVEPVTGKERKTARG